MNLCLCPNCATAYRQMRLNSDIMESIRKSFFSKNDTDIENSDYVSISIDDDDELWFTQTHFAEIRELMKLSEEIKKSKHPTPPLSSTDNENEKSGMSVYAGYIGKTIRRRDGFIGTVTNVITNGDNPCIEVQITGGKNVGKTTMIQLSFILKNKGVYSISD